MMMFFCGLSGLSLLFVFFRVSKLHGYSALFGKTGVTGNMQCIRKDRFRENPYSVRGRSFYSLNAFS